MTCSPSSSTSGAALPLTLALALCGCAGRMAAPGGVPTAEAAPPGRQARPVGTPAAARARIAMLPVVNVSGGIAPMRELGAAWQKALADEAVEVVAGAAVDAFLARHRVRYTGGIDSATAALAAKELGVEQVLISSLVAYAAAPSPRFALEARLVTTDADPRILWAGGFSRLGDESPGVFDLGVIHDFDALAARSLRGLARSASEFLQGRSAQAIACAPARRFAPRVAYRGPALDVRPPLRVAVLPFQNETRRRNAGDVLSLAFVRQLETLPNVRVVEPGVVRDDLLRYRMILHGGISLDVARITTELVEADLALAGIVRTYDDAINSAGAPRIEFTVLLLDRANNEVLWRSSSYSAGDDGVFFFDAGKVSTAGDLACRMAQSTIRGFLERPATPSRRLSP